MTTRTFHFVEGNSSKFWTISLDGSSHTVQWGRIGTNGQTQTKEFGSDDEAQRSYEKLVAEKVKKGYVEQGADASGQAAAGSQPAAASSGPVGSRVAPAPAPKAKAAAKAPAAAPAEAPAAVPSASAEPSPPPEPKVDFKANRALLLEPTDWFWATWRDLPPLPREEAAPFDLQACADRIARMPTASHGWNWQWDKLSLQPKLFREEAHFWLTAMTQPNRLKGTKELAAKIRTQKFDGDLSMDRITEMLRKSQTQPAAELFLVLANLVPIVELIQRLVDVEVETRNSGATQRAYEGNTQWLWYMVDGFRKYALPYLTPEERSAIREIVSPLMTPTIWPADHYEAVPFSIRVGAFVGSHDAVLKLVETLKDDTYTAGEDWGDYYQRPQEIILGLGNPELVECHMRRLKLRLKEEMYIRGWLAHTEYGALDYVRESIQTIGNKDEAQNLVAALALVQAPEAAQPMLELMLNSKAPRNAREWLEGNLGHSLPGLMPLAGGRGRVAEAALEFLRTQRRRGYGDALATAAEGLPEEVAARVRTLVIDYREKEYMPFDAATTPEWLQAGLAEVKKTKKPGWFQATDLPPLTVGDHRLSEAQVEALLGALQASKLGAPHPLVQAVRENVDRSSADTFAWRLFELWLAEGAPSKENWAMVAVGLLGGDASALKLTPMIRVWPGESQHQRAVLGLECLRAIGTDTALMQINGIAQKLKFKGLKSKAQECMEAIASDRGLTRAELEDRIVPDCDLDERGTRIFDFGPRQFRFVLGAGMKPMIKEEDGKVRPDLPKPNSKDDEALAIAAVEEWKLLKKVVAEATKIQVVRLEQAMVTGRRWNAEEFSLLLVRHPLMTNFVQLLVWGAYDAEGRLTGTFRVTEDQSLADENDDLFTLEPGSLVGIIHALHLSDEQRRTWGELLSDYELVPPFPQLGRGIFGLEAGEAEKDEIERFNKGKIGKIPPTSLVGTLDRLGWVRGMPEDGGVFWEHSKPFYGANVTAILNYEDGIPIGYMEGWDDQELTGCFFVPGIYDPRMYVNHEKKLRLGEIDPVVISEVLADLTVLASKAK